MRRWALFLLFSVSNYSLIQLFRNPNETAINLTCLPIRNIWYDEKYHKKDNVEDPDAENSPEQDTGQIYPRLDGDEGFFSSVWPTQARMADWVRGVPGRTHSSCRSIQSLTKYCLTFLFPFPAHFLCQMSMFIFAPGIIYLLPTGFVWLVLEARRDGGSLLVRGPVVWGPDVASCLCRFNQKQ